MIASGKPRQAKRDERGMSGVPCLAVYVGEPGPAAVTGALCEAHGVGGARRASGSGTSGDRAPAKRAGRAGSGTSGDRGTGGARRAIRVRRVGRAAPAQRAGPAVSGERRRRGISASRVRRAAPKRRMERVAYNCRVRRRHPREENRMTNSPGIDPTVPPSGARQCGRRRRVVVPPAPMCQVRAHRMLRHFALAARNRAPDGHRSLGHPQLRARGGVVLEL